MIVDPADGKILDFHFLPAKARIDVDNGEMVVPGQLLARQPKEAKGTTDITSGLPRVTIANVLGISAADALSRIRHDGFRPRTRGVFATKPKQIVVAQNPDPGTKAARNTSRETARRSATTGIVKPPNECPTTIGASPRTCMASITAAA